jgi:hypothetical protein
VSEELTTRDRPIAFTASATLTPRHHGILITNRGAAGAVTITMPPGQKGHRQRFRKVAAQTFTIACSGSQKILNKAGTQVSTLAVDAAAEVEFDGTDWVVIGELASA